MINELTYEIDENKLKFALTVKELPKGRTWSVRPDLVVPSASLIKLFIMAKVFEMVSQGILDLNRSVIISKEEMIEETLYPDHPYRLEELITLMITHSDNVATNILIDTIGMGPINRYIINHGFSGTVLQRKMLDFDGRQAGRENYTTASDVAKFLDALYKRTLISSDYSWKMLEIMKGQQEKSLMRFEFPPEIVVANKHGDLDGIKHDAGIVYGLKGDYVFVMLTWDGQDNRYQYEAIRKVSKRVYDCLQSC